VPARLCTGERDLAHAQEVGKIGGWRLDIRRNVLIWSDQTYRILVDGRVKWVRGKAYLEFDRDQKLTGGFGTAQDIDARTWVEETLRRSERNVTVYSLKQCCKV
jgi:hypothetical protein